MTIYAARRLGFLKEAFEPLATRVIVLGAARVHPLGDSTKGQLDADLCVC